MAGSVLPHTRVPVGGDTAVLYAKHVSAIHLVSKVECVLLHSCVSVNLAIMGNSAKKLTDPDDVVTFSSESFDENGTFLGNYTTLALDERNSLAQPLRFACLSVKCPEDEGLKQKESLNTIKVVTNANTNLRCNITSARLPTTRGNEDTKVETILKSGNDYGPLYGIYVAYGSTMSAKTIAEKMCRLGGNFFNHDQAILPARAFELMCAYGTESRSGFR
uniref:Uncharacterized protein n=1 Tax=Magallana gigas TaxID=29159 RepID=K1QNK2_MAGGI